MISLALISSSEVGDGSSARDVREELEGWSVDLILNGIPLATVEAPISRYGARHVGFQLQTGRVMAPSDLPPGDYVLAGTIHSPEAEAFDLGSIAFHVDAPGTGACGTTDALTFREVQ